MELDDAAETAQASGPMPVREASSIAIGLVVSGSVIAGLPGTTPPMQGK